jgi:hypothetical protein
MSFGSGRDSMTNPHIGESEARMHKRFYWPSSRELEDILEDIFEDILGNILGDILEDI